MTITIDTITTPEGGVLVVPGDRQIARMRAVANKRTKEIRADAAQIEDPATRASTLALADTFASNTAAAVHQIEEFRSRFADQIVSAAYPLTPYTYGQFLAAKDRHTTYDSGVPVLRGDALNDELAALGLGMTVEQFHGHPRPIAEALLSAVLEALEPSMEKIDFLYLQQICSEKGDPLAESSCSH